MCPVDGNRLACYRPIMGLKRLWRNVGVLQAVQGQLSLCLTLHGLQACFVFITLYRCFVLVHIILTNWFSSYGNRYMKCANWATVRYPTRSTQPFIHYVFHVGLYTFAKAPYLMWTGVTRGVLMILVELPMLRSKQAMRN